MNAAFAWLCAGALFGSVATLATLFFLSLTRDERREA